MSDSKQEPLSPSATMESSVANLVLESNTNFIVRTVVTETISQTQEVCQTYDNDNNNNVKVQEEKEEERENTLRAVPVAKSNVTSSTTETHTQENLKDSEPSCSKAIVPLSSCLPSKLLRLHAKRSAQALLQELEQLPSLESRFNSEEGAIGVNNSESLNHEQNSSGASVATTNSTGSVECLEDKLIDVGMGSSIEDSEESMEEEDELKPLAIDNHVLNCDNELDMPSNNANQLVDTTINTEADASTAVLSEANLERFRRHHHQQTETTNYPNMENIYLHPNFKYQLEERENNFECSPPPAVAPANSPTERKPVHRSFLSMKKTYAEVDKPNSVISQTDTIGSTEGPVVNEIDNLDPALIPSSQLAAEIAEAVEFYFSNDVILKDAFLLKHVRRNKDGFVSLKLVSSFKRVRQLTKEWKVVGYAVRQKSRKIELNDIGTKVRRVEPLPNFDETMPSRTIVVCDLPHDKLSIEKVSDIFSKCGEIALIRILKPGMNIPVDVRQFMNKYPEMQQKECALVEYLESSSARDAKNLQGPFQVHEMVAPKKKTGKKAVVQITAPVARMVENYRYYNDASYERTRGGSFSGIIQHDDLRYKLKRNNSDFPTKALAEMHPYHGPSAYHAQHNNNTNTNNAAYVHQHSPTHRGSYGSGEFIHQYHQPQPHYQYQHQQHPNRANIIHHSEHIDVPNHSAIINGPANNYYAYSPRRYSNTSTVSAGNNLVSETTAPPSHNHNNNNSMTNNNNISNSGHNLSRRLSNCSDNYSTYSETSRRLSNCSDNIPQRRDSNCSENCPCTRRISDVGQQPEVYRKISQSSIGSGGCGERRFSNGSLQYERPYPMHNNNNNNSSSNNEMIGGSNGNISGFPRRMSNDFNYERKPSLEGQTSAVPYENDGNVGGGGGGYNVFTRRYSNNFNVSNKLANYDNAQYINGRRVSTDSGYDRRCSFGSEYEGSPRSRTSSFLTDGQPRSRTNSFLDNASPRSRSGSLAQRAAENLVRTPIGPDGSKGFCTRARKLGQTISPVN